MASIVSAHANIMRVLCKRVSSIVNILRRYVRIDDDDMREIFRITLPEYLYIFKTLLVFMWSQAVTLRHLLHSQIYRQPI